jgi:hypothetical protein
VLTDFSDVNSWYNSMVVTFRKKYTNGLEFTFNYTLGKATDGGEIQGQFGTFNGGGSNFPVDPKNRKLEYATSDLDQRQRFTSMVVWAPDWGKHFSNPTAMYVIGGWTFSTIVSVFTGQPVTGVMNGVPAGGVLGGLTGGSNNNSGTALSTGRIYDEARNSFKGPGQANDDFRISRTFAIKERVKFSVLGEAFNLFNFTNIYTVQNIEYNYSASGSGACGSHTNNCLVQNIGPTGFLTPTATNNGLSGARQLQIAARLSF